MSIILKKKRNIAFSIYMNDHAAFIKIFETMLNFLHKQYFSRIAFEVVYLTEHKTVVLKDSLKLLEFQDTAKELRSSLKHREKIINRVNSTNKEKLNAFL